MGVIGLVMELVVEAVVETRATPRKWCIVDGRGRGIGRRNGSAIAEDFCVKAMVACSVVRFRLPPRIRIFSLKFHPSEAVATKPKIRLALSPKRLSFSNLGIRTQISRSLSTPRLGGPWIASTTSQRSRTPSRTVAIMADNAPTSATDILNGAQSKAKTPEEVAKENDLLPKIITHLDRHLIFPLLQFVADQEDEPSPEITKAKYELLKKTNMTDYVATLYCELEGVDEAPKEFASKREEVLNRLELFGQETEKITELLGREDVVTSLRSDKVANLEYLKKEHDVGIL